MGEAPMERHGARAVKTAPIPSYTITIPVTARMITPSIHSLV